MGLGDWLRKTFGGRGPSVAMVPFLDGSTGRVVRIPASELRPGTVQVRLQPSGEVVWALPDELIPGEVRHPEFDEGTRESIRQIQAAFAEHRPLNFEEWEHGFRCDGHPEREIAIWSHAADVYRGLAGNEPAADRREDVYRCVVACMTTGPDTVWHVLRPQVLSRTEAELVVNRYFNRQAG